MGATNQLPAMLVEIRFLTWIACTRFPVGDSVVDNVEEAAGPFISSLQYVQYSTSPCPISSHACGGLCDDLPFLA